jgi:hypothetical protein
MQEGGGVVHTLHRGVDTKLSGENGLIDDDDGDEGAG